MTLRLFVCLAVLLGGPATLRAQDRRQVERNASFTLGASFGDGGTALASTIGVGIGWRSRLGIDVELAHARKLDFTIDLCPPPRVCVIGGQRPVVGRTVSLVPQLTIRLTPASAHVRMYAVGGVGLGHIRQRYYLVPEFVGGDRPELTRSKLAPAMSFGAGATLDITRRIAVGCDLRSLHLRDDEGEEARFIIPAGWIRTVRVGARIVWRF
ncbi:MAG TPA: hypothetical protein VFT47_04075 [Vicinamibacterales bacterium]|nr:hypothetical protein [Vicinamibacterales bacterium]